jgi:uncharacterized membrane protein
LESAGLRLHIVHMTLLRRNTTLAKTVTFAAVHFIVAFSIGYLLTGSVAIASALALIEPLANTVAYYAHERVWARLNRSWSASAAAHTMKSAMASALPHPPIGVDTASRTASEACSTASGR